LRELADHVAEHEPPEPVIAALLELRSVLTAPEDHLDLGHCLRSLGLHDAAREELTTGLGDDLDPHYRDEGIRGLLSIEVRDFDRRFARAVDELAGAADPTEAVAEMESFLAVQPEFWPALFFKAMGAKRLGDEELALDCLADLLRMCPQQPDALHEMAELFAARGNPKRALECIEDALIVRSDDPRLFASMARYLESLDRIVEARQAADDALQLDPDDLELQRLRARLG
ncbi:MAG: hypothetical protein KDC87_21740, partial [Planctomycetes bacterium]|nr:hypothetical protein [Planctomycetota bacterium]